MDGPLEGWAAFGGRCHEGAAFGMMGHCNEGYVCVPRSGSASKLERVTIAENSEGGVNSMLMQDFSGNIDRTLVAMHHLF